MMSRVLHEMQKDGFFIYPPPPSPSSSLSNPNSTVKYENESTQSSSLGRISPVILFIIITLAVIFFISGLVHLLVRYLIKRPSSLPIHQSNSHPETPRSHALQRQLQHLFRLHDSGLDQALIDALPVFYYKDIMGLKEPFDCAVCLCELSDNDKLRLLPMCSHAFHITCIDTWLLSNSTCPLCRGTLVNIGLPMENPVCSFDILREISNGFSSDAENGFSCHQRPTIMEESAAPKRVFSVRLGKFRSMNEDGKERGQVEISSSCNLDARRCYSMGTVQYVVGDSDLRVALSHDSDSSDEADGVSSDVKPVKERGDHGSSLVDGEVDGKKISRRTRGDSFSVSKIWLWPKKSRLPSSTSTHMGVPSPSFLSYYKFSNEL